MVRLFYLAVMKKYVKFTEGKGTDLTLNKAYEVINFSPADNPIIKDNAGVGITIRNPNSGRCAHLSGKIWQWCDENGKEVSYEQRN